MQRSWIPTRLSPEQREERRRAAAAPFPRALRRRPQTGRPPKLSAAEWRRLATLLRRGAVACRYGTAQWTLERVAHRIGRGFGVRHHARYLPLPSGTRRVTRFGAA